MAQETILEEHHLPHYFLLNGIFQLRFALPKNKFNVFFFEFHGTKHRQKPYADSI